MTENMKNLDEEIAQQIKNDHIKKMVFTARNYSLEDVETIVCGNLNTIAYEYEKALSALRASWEREKANLEAELADHKKNHNTAKWSEVLSKRMDQIAVLEKEKAGLEERVWEYKNEWESALYREQGLKAENERLAKESERRKFLLKECEKESKFRGEEIAHLKESRSKWAKQSSENADEVDRLTSALGAAHGAFNHVKKELEETALVGATQTEKLRIKEIWEFILEILKDPTGKQAHERWKAMEAVVEAARACYEEDDFITENSPGSFERDKKLGEALEAYESRGKQ